MVTFTIQHRHLKCKILDNMKKNCHRETTHRQPKEPQDQQPPEWHCDLYNTVREYSDCWQTPLKNARWEIKHSLILVFHHIDHIWTVASSTFAIIDHIRQVCECFHMYQNSRSSCSLPFPRFRVPRGRSAREATVPVSTPVRVPAHRCQSPAPARPWRLLKPNWMVSLNACAVQDLIETMIETILWRDARNILVVWKTSSQVHLWLYC